MSYTWQQRAEYMREERDALSAEVERLREALRARDDTLAMVIGLPGFQRRHPNFAEGIRRLITPSSPAVVPSANTQEDT
jgi:hypothetical protein